MGNVYRPTALSPMMSWKSWAWIVVARMAAITDIEKAPGKSSLHRSEAIVYAQSKSMVQDWRATIPATKVDPVAKQE